MVSPNRKNGFAGNPIYANFASNNAALAQSRAHPLRSKRESDLLTGSDSGADVFTKRTGDPESSQTIFATEFLQSAV